MSKLGVNILLILLIFLIACKDSAVETPPASNNEVEAQPKKTAKKPAVIEIYVWVDKLRLRSKATTKSEVVATLREGEALTFLEERSDFTEKINLRGTLFDEPWLKVATKTGKEGWVYGGGIKFYKIGTDEAPTIYDDCFKLRKERKITQSKKCLERTQFRELKKESSLVKESSSGLTFNLLGGETFKLQNTKGDSTYTFRYYLRNMAVFVAHVQHKTGENYVLINDKTGKVLFTKGFPKASADGEHIACLHTDWKEKGGFNGLQIFTFVNNQLSLVYEKALEEFRPILPKWIDEKTLQFTLLEKSDKRNRKSRYGQLVKETNGEWKIEL